jgi:hypothetical protein
LVKRVDHEIRFIRHNKQMTVGLWCARTPKRTVQAIETSAGIHLSMILWRSACSDPTLFISFTLMDTKAGRVPEAPYRQATDEAKIEPQLAMTVHCMNLAAFRQEKKTLGKAHQ